MSTPQLKIQSKKNPCKIKKQPSSGCIGKVLVELAAALPVTALGMAQPECEQRRVSELTAAIIIYRAL